MNKLAFVLIVMLFYVFFVMLLAQFPWVCLLCAGGALVKGHIGRTIFWVFLYFIMLDN